MSAFIDLAGQQFAELTVMHRAGTRKNVTYWSCRCSCGRLIEVGAGCLRRAKRTTCGHADPNLATGREPWPGNLGYLIHPDGSILGPRGRVVTPHVDPNGYQRYTIIGYGRRFTAYVHVIVCETFHGPRPEGMEVAHGNGVKSDCRSTNLRWDTPVGNAADKIEHDTVMFGERNGFHRLTEADVRAIRSSNDSAVTLARTTYPVSHAAISRARSGQTWAHVS